MAEFTILFNQVLVLFILMGIGCALVKSGKISSELSGQLTFLLCYIIMPSIVFYSFLREFDSEKFHNLLLLFGVSVLIHLLAIAAGQLFFNSRLVPDPDKRRALRFSAVYSNCGFMGFPLLLSIIGIDGLFYGTAYNAVFGLFVWTHGFLLFARRFDLRSLLKAFVNPNIIAIVGGLLCFYYSIRLPAPILLSVKFIADLNTGLSMMVIGMLLAKLPLKSLCDDFCLPLCVLLRNIVLPLIVVFCAWWGGLKGDLLLTTAILAACPVAGTVVIFSALFNRDNVYPGKLLLLSTLSSLVTVPLIIMFAKYLLTR